MMKSPISALIIVAFIIASSVTVRSAQQVPTKRATLENCSLALDMFSKTFLNDLVLNGRPMPSVQEQNNALECANYVIGFKDAIYVSQLFNEKNGMTPLICLPENNLSNELAIRLILKYLHDNPPLEDGAQSALVFNAFYYAYPCKK